MCRGHKICAELGAHRVDIVWFVLLLQGLGTAFKQGIRGCFKIEFGISLFWGQQ